MPKTDPKTKKIKELEELYQTSVRQNEFKAGQILELKEQVESLNETISGFSNSSVENLHAIVDQSIWMRNFIETMCLPTEKLEAKKNDTFDQFDGNGMRRRM